jgi:dTDP-glucose 4,6-dehydratase
MILAGLAGSPLPVYAGGENVRDWVHVEDHAQALLHVLHNGRPGETYNITGAAERRNIDVVKGICTALDAFLPDSPHRPHEALIEYVDDRPGHDFRYALDGEKLSRDLGWIPTRRFEEGLRDTVAWYLENKAWWEPIRRDVYQGQRQGQAS